MHERTNAQREMEGQLTLAARCLKIYKITNYEIDEQNEEDNS